MIMKNVMFGLLILVSTTAEAAVMCGVFEGSSCNTPLYYMQFCARITFRQHYCERLCARQEPICGVEDFTPWVQAYEDIGRRGIRGDLQSHANEFDDAGTMLYLSQKTVTVCTKSLLGWVPIKAPKVCPKAGAATNGTCTAGTRLNPTTGTCVVYDSTGGSGTQDFQNLMNQSGMLVATQNQHFGYNPETDTNVHISAVTADVTPGLTQQTNAQASDGGVLGSLAGAFKAEKSKSGSKGSSTSSGTGMVLEASTAAPDSVKDTSNGDQVYASADTAKDSYRSGGGGVAGGSAGGGSSWFGSGGSAAPTAPAAGDVAFSGKASRGLASGDVLNVEDPANYFMMSDIDVSLFERATAQCRCKEKDLNYISTFMPRRQNWLGFSVCRFGCSGSQRRTCFSARGSRESGSVRTRRSFGDRGAVLRFSSEVIQR